MELQKRIMSDYRGEDNQLGFCSKKQRTLGHHLLHFPAYGKLIDSVILIGETFNNYYTLLDGRILGLVIDLNSHWNNNGLNNFNDDEIKHVKIPCDDSVVPSNESVNLFVHEIRKFVVQNHNQKYKKYVLVHSVNGHNKAGYMIVHYLMRTRKISVTEAIQIFADFRPPGILKFEYINSLYTFYHEISKPEPEASLIFNGNSKQQSMMKNNNVIGDSIPSDQENDLRNICYDLLKLPKAGGKGNHQEKLQFPGTNHVPLNKENIELLKQRCYYASWKAEGTRYMMLITIDGCYLIDTEFNFRRVQMRFPSVIVNKSHHLTLLDGEMIIDTTKNSGKQIRRYLVTDIMAINSISLVDREFHERWDIIDKDIIQPRRNNHNHNKLGYRLDLEPFRVRRKNYWCLSTVPNLLNELIPNLSHESGGLIFQGWKDPYIPYTNKLALKWRNAEKDTVCFLYEVVDEEDHLLYVHDDEGEKIFVAANRIVFEKNCNSPPEYLGKMKIIECYWDDEQKMWICVRIRSDRSSPDEFNKYLEVARRIVENVNDEMLVNEIYKVHISPPNYGAGRRITDISSARIPNGIQPHFL